MGDRLERGPTEGVKRPKLYLALSHKLGRPLPTGVLRAHAAYRQRKLADEEHEGWLEIGYVEVRPACYQPFLTLTERQRRAYREGRRVPIRGGFFGHGINHKYGESRYDANGFEKLQ